jgi:3-hydroxyacyl-CoA dehydrogenase
VRDAAAPDPHTDLEEIRMTTVAFIGLGIMGAPMADHLVDAGFDVIGYNLTPDRVARLSSTAAGGPRASPRRYGTPTSWR